MIDRQELIALLDQKGVTFNGTRRLGAAGMLSFREELADAILELDRPAEPQPVTDTGTIFHEEPRPAD